MRQRIRSHLTFANVVSLAALFVALGGTATAVTYVVSSNSQVGPGTISGHRPPSGDHANIIGNSVNGGDVGNNSLTGTDIKDRSGVDTCQTPLLAQFGPICAGSDGALRTWAQANQYCSDFGLRLPSISEALTMARSYDVPGVPGASGDPYFWTDEESEIGGTLTAREVDDNGNTFFLRETDTNVTVCVTDPSA